MTKQKKEEYKQEEWGGWKFVSNMLDNPDKDGIYPTSKCYKELYDFVVSQKNEALKQQREENPTWICVVCGKKIQLSFNPIKDKKAWTAFFCPFCGHKIDKSN